MTSDCKRRRADSSGRSGARSRTALTPAATRQMAAASVRAAATSSFGDFLCEFMSVLLPPTSVALSSRVTHQRLVMVRAAPKLFAASLAGRIDRESGEDELLDTRQPLAPGVLLLNQRRVTHHRLVVV